MKGENKKTGFTIVELLTVLAIIALLVGILVPSMNRVRFFARNTRQSSQLTAIDMAITMFRNDYGQYPRSDYVLGYCGAQKLAEAMVGHDLLGFHPDSQWNPQGIDLFDNELYNITTNDTRNARIGPYLEVSKANAFTIQQLFVGPSLPLWGQTTVLCDTFKRLKATISPLTPGETTILDAGIPILYFRANTNQTTIGAIYNYSDNEAFINVKASKDGIATDDPISAKFYAMIKDPKATSTVGSPWPYRADSYILISAGADGLYGTADDITNFGN